MRREICKESRRMAAVATAALLIAATTAADASRVRLKAIDPHWIAHGRQIAFC